MIRFLQKIPIECVPFIVVIFFILTAVWGIDESRYRKIVEMPAEIQYQVIVHNYGWPDQFYSESYALEDPNGFRLETYWTYYNGWQYHPEPLVITNVDSTINKLTRR